MNKILCTLLSAVCSSCMSVIPHQVTFTASPAVGQKAVSEKQPLYLAVVDARPQKTVGVRSGLIGASITAPDVIAHIERQAQRGLEAKGFALTQEKVSRQMILSLTRFAWETRSQSGIAQIGVAIDLKVDIRAPFSAPITRFYVYDDHQFAVMTPLGEDVTERFNAGLANVFSQLFADTTLFDALTKEGS